MLNSHFVYCYLGVKHGKLILEPSSSLLVIWNLYHKLNVNHSMIYNHLEYLFSFHHLIKFLIQEKKYFCVEQVISYVFQQMNIVVKNVNSTIVIGM